MQIRLCGTHCENYKGIGIAGNVEVIRCFYQKTDKYLPLQAAKPCLFGLEKTLDEPPKQEIIKKLHEDI